ncbi:hypothetical protein DPMN_129675 [Dreissena polymorpha]|uniref:Uncharacterized protein n=1 Tax=Dreissena polymorpha TaxID=45954 RepID=A0A9D4JYH0_DREPO|nr:hypothetical protein DPMN_129675 [Dreissena polymorpha]
MGDKRKRPVGPNRTKMRLLNKQLDRKPDSHTEGVCDCVWLQIGRPLDTKHEKNLIGHFLMKCPLRWK